MRRIFFILSICIALAACDDVPVAGEGMVQGTQVLALDADLVRYDSIMQSRPDSALVLLLSYPAQKEDETLSDSLSVKNDGINAFAAMLNRNYFYLLVSEALFKTDNMQTVRPQVQQAEYFFDSLAMQHPDNDDITFLSARSHYMNGVGFYENDSVVEACKEYLNALEIMEAHFKEEELVGQKAKFMALSYGRLGDLFSNQFMMKNAIECYKNALFFCKIKPTSKYTISKSLILIGNQYDRLNDTISASYYYNCALQELPDYDNLIYRDIVSCLSFLNYRLRHKTQISLDSLYHMAVLSADMDEMLARYMIIGSIFYEEKQYDSAQVYLEEVYKYGNDIVLRTQAAEFLQEISKSFGNNDDVVKYAIFLANNKQIPAENSVQVSTLNMLYHDSFNKNNKKIKEEKHFAEWETFTIIILIATFMVLVVFFATHKWSKKRIAHHKAVYDGKINEVHSALKQSERVISDLKMKIDVKQFIDEPVCQNILNIVNEQQFKSKINYQIYKDYELGREQLIALREAANIHYDNFTIRLKKQFPKLTNDDIDYCCLYLLGLKDSEISALMQKEYSTVRYRDNKIKNILNSDKNITETLYNIATL